MTSPQQKRGPGQSALVWQVIAVWTPPFLICVSQSSCVTGVLSHWPDAGSWPPIPHWSQQQRWWGRSQYPLPQARLPVGPGLVVVVLLVVVLLVVVLVVVLVELVVVLVVVVELVVVVPPSLLVVVVLPPCEAVVLPPGEVESLVVAVAPPCVVPDAASPPLPPDSTRWRSENRPHPWLATSAMAAAENAHPASCRDLPRAPLIRTLLSPLEPLDERRRPVQGALPMRPD
jgi:hypothetical protein